MWAEECGRSGASSVYLEECGGEELCREAVSDLYGGGFAIWVAIQR